MVYVCIPNFKLCCTHSPSFGTADSKKWLINFTKIFIKIVVSGQCVHYFNLVISKRELIWVKIFLEINSRNSLIVISLYFKYKQYMQTGYFVKLVRNGTSMLKSLLKKSFPMFCVFLFGCASSYHSILQYEPQKINKAENEDISVRTGYQMLENNPRLERRANNNSMIMLKVEIDKKNTDNQINIDGMYLQLKDGSEIRSLNADQYYKETKRYAWPFAFYGLLWFTISSSECNGYNCSSSVIPIPIGLIPMLINIGAQSSSNVRYLHDLRENSLNDKSQNSGYVFFRNEYGQREQSFIIKYTVGDTSKKIIVPLS